MGRREGEGSCNALLLLTRIAACHRIDALDSGSAADLVLAECMTFFRHFLQHNSGPFTNGSEGMHDLCSSVTSIVSKSTFAKRWSIV